MMFEGPGTEREPYLFLNEKWGVRVVHARVGAALDQEWLFFYLDGPFDGVDDGSLDSILPWERYATGPLFLFGDYPGVPTSWQGKTVFKQSCAKSSPYLSFFYVVSLGGVDPRPIENCQFKVGFHGCSRTHDCRPKLRDVIDKLVPSYYCDNQRAWWDFSAEQQTQFRRSYLTLLENTKFIFCPRGRGLNSIRFFEALKLGRIPVLISDEAKLPLEDVVDYNEFVVRVPEADVGLADQYIFEWLDKHNLAAASARASWVSHQYFDDPEKFVAFSLQSLALAT